MQVLGEFFNVLVRKIGQQKEEAKEMVVNLLETFEVVKINEFSVLKAMEISIRYKVFLLGQFNCGFSIRK